MESFITWTGISGHKYEFEAYAIGTVFNPLSGVYIACVETTAGRWKALYVGETQSFHDRLNAGFENHDGLKCAHARGATHLAVLRVNGASERLVVETDLRHSLDPLCNKQGVPARGTLLGL